jgi:hypothetical protein
MALPYGPGFPLLSFFLLAAYGEKNTANRKKGYPLQSLTLPKCNSTYKIILVALSYIKANIIMILKK